jgi:3-phosphoshikimate 1-carboxyvinyltransferase
MNVSIHPGSIFGTVKAPASKSLTQRALAAGLLAGGSTIIRHSSFCDDCRAAAGIATSLGGDISAYPDFITVQPGLRPVSTVTLNCGESGLALRMFAPVSATIVSRSILTGEGSLTGRPVTMISDALPQFGVHVETSDGHLPVTISGKLLPGRAIIDGSSGSQLLTGLLMALPVLGSDSEVTVNNLKSKPYISLTLELLEEFGITVINQEFNLFRIPGRQSYRPHEYEVEGDWSGAAFLLVSGAIAGEVTVSNLNCSSAQADRAVLDALRQAGASIKVENQSVTAARAELGAFTFDATDCPDLFPPLAALAAYCNGTSTIRGARRLTTKESDRGKAITDVLQALNINAVTEDDEMIIKGGEVRGACVSSHNDHRIAMMAAVAAPGSRGEVTITGAEAVNKSFPEFFDTLIRLGVVMVT